MSTDMLRRLTNCRFIIIIIITNQRAPLSIVSVDVRSLVKTYFTIQRSQKFEPT